jgi:hypothetical protein
MPDKNVYRPSFGENVAHTEKISSYRVPEQLELFDHKFGSVRAISYLDIAFLDQDRLIRSLIMNAVTKIIDLRRVPVFPKPRFDHRFLMSYFYERSVDYIEFAMITKVHRRCVSADEALNRWFAETQFSSLTACIVDEDAVRDGAVAFFRQSIAHSIDGYIELHPRALI